MRINRKKAMKLWFHVYGDQDYAEDFDGALMRREAYGDPNYYEFHDGQKIYCGWNIHHILPKACGGSDDLDNLACTNVITNELAGDKTSFHIDGRLYQVRKIKYSRHYKIVLIK